MAYGVRMRSLRARVVRVMLGALGALVVASLAGCAASPVPAPTTSATPDAAAPLFASDEEALAAAEAAYAAYQDMSNQIARDGGVDVDRLAPLVTAEFFPVAVAGFEEFRTEGWTGVGGIRFDSVKLQQVKQAEGHVTVKIYLCMDVQEAKLVNREGIDVTPTTRKDRTPLVVSLGSMPGPQPQLLVESSKVWDGDDFC